MDITQAVRAGRRAGQQTYTDTFKCERGGGEPVTDPDTGQVTYPKATVWEGKGKIRISNPAVSNPEAGGAIFNVQTMSLHVPIGAGPFQIGDTLVLTASALDPQRVGQTVMVTALHDTSNATAQRLKVEQLT